MTRRSRGYMDNSIPPDVDWVTARDRCSIFKMFKELESRVESDVRKRNETLKSDDFIFERAKGRDDYFSVLHRKHRRIVRFFLKEQDVIEVTGENVKVNFK